MEDKERVILEKFYKPSDKELEVIGKVYDKYWKFKMTTDATYDELKNMSIREYVSSARDKFYGNVPLSTHYFYLGRKPFFSNEYRDALKQIIVHVSNLVQNPQFYGVEGLDYQLSLLLEALHRFYQRGKLSKIRNFLQFWQAVIDGTVIVYVDAGYINRRIKDLTYFEPFEYEVEFEEKELKEFRFIERVVNLDDFLIPQVNKFGIQELNECIERNFMNYKEFKSRYGKYPNAQFVFPGARLSSDSMLAKLLDKTLLSSENVEIIKYYNKKDDEFIVVANGVWINPIGKKKQEISPLIWNHKRLPFAYAIYDPISPNFFYGASLLHQISSPIEAFENLIEMSLERIYRSINPPVFVSAPRVPENLTLESGKLIPIGTFEVREMQMGSVDSNVWLMNSFLQNMVRKTVTPLIPQPQAPTRQPKTAAENLLRQQQTIQSMSLPTNMFAYLLEQKSFLQIKNILQFMSAEDFQKVIGNKAYKNLLRVSKVPTIKGIRDVEIRFTKNLSSSGELLQEAILRSKELGTPLEIIEINADLLKNLEFDVYIEFDVEKTPQVAKALFVNFVEYLISRFGDRINPDKVLARLFEVWNENPADYLKDEVVENLRSYYNVSPSSLSEFPYLKSAIQVGGEGVAQGVKGGAPPFGSKEFGDLMAPDLKDLLNVESI